MGHKGFDFAPAQGPNIFDQGRSRSTVPDNIQWTAKAVHNAIEAHVTARSVYRTERLIRRIVGGITNIDQIQPMYYAAIVSRLCEDMADRPYRVNDYAR